MRRRKPMFWEISDVKHAPWEMSTRWHREDTWRPPAHLFPVTLWSQQWLGFSDVPSESSFIFLVCLWFTVAAHSPCSYDFFYQTSMLDVEIEVTTNRRGDSERASGRLSTLQVLGQALDQAPVPAHVIRFHPSGIHVEQSGFCFPILYSKNPRDGILKL